jgi:DNA-binding NarL/FixJ family response regulator
LEPYVDVVAVANDGEGLLQHVGNLLPDAVITDVSMPRLNGLDACCRISRTYPAVRVVIVSELLDDDLTSHAFELGASAVLRKSHLAQLPAVVLGLFTATAAEVTRSRLLETGSRSQAGARATKTTGR